MDFSDFLDPQSVAVVGASRHKGKVGYEVLSNLLKGGYPGKVYPINPSAESIQGLEVLSRFALDRREDRAGDNRCSGGTRPTSDTADGYKSLCSRAKGYYSNGRGCKDNSQPKSVIERTAENEP